jgi:hypothetical protein
MPHDHPHDHPHIEPTRAGPGHNGAKRRATTWQMPATADGTASGTEPDFDLVEKSFCELALVATDATSFLRLVGVPFVTRRDDGTVMRLLSYRIEHEAEVGAIAPGFDAADPVYHPLPGARVNRRQHLRFVYHTAGGLQELSLVEIRGLPDLLIP